MNVGDLADEQRCQPTLVAAHEEDYDTTQSTFFRTHYKGEGGCGRSGRVSGLDFLADVNTVDGFPTSSTCRCIYF